MRGRPLENVLSAIKVTLVSVLYKNPVRILKNLFFHTEKFLTLSGQSQCTPLQLSSLLPSVFPGKSQGALNKAPDISGWWQSCCSEIQLGQSALCSSLYFINVSISRVIKCDMCMLKCFNCPPIPSPIISSATCPLPGAWPLSTLSHLLERDASQYLDQASRLRISLWVFLKCQIDLCFFERWAA